MVGLGLLVFFLDVSYLCFILKHLCGLTVTCVLLTLFYKLCYHFLTHLMNICIPVFPLLVGSLLIVHPGCDLQPAHLISAHCAFVVFFKNISCHVNKERKKESLFFPPAF